MEPASAAMDSSSKAPEPIQVLFVEDEFLIREWVAQALTEQGFAVKKASNAVEALRQIACGPVRHFAHRHQSAWRDGWDRSCSPDA